jgi:hypothetical protein
MDKPRSSPTRYTLTLRRADGKPEAANLHVRRVYEQFMVSRAAPALGK